MLQEELFNKAIEEWRTNRGKGTAILPKNVDDKVLMLWILQRMYSNDASCNTLIVVSDFKERQDIIEYLTNQPDADENNEEFKGLIASKRIKIFTSNFIHDRFENTHRMSFRLTILYHVDRIDVDINEVLKVSLFKLAILNNLIQDSHDRTLLYSHCPFLTTFDSVAVEQIRLSTPVEEYRQGLTIPTNSETGKLLRYYNEYVTTSINIFGSFEIMEQVRVGNAALNISANTIALQIAQENGWNDHLDMSSDYNRQIDELYNPIRIRDRAIQTYDIIRKRTQLLSDFDDKLECIFNIVKDNIDKNILIINRRAEFADKVTEYLNAGLGGDVCKSYHDKLEPIPAVNASGYPLFYKSGEHKGERRMMASAAQKTLYETLYNRGDISILSTTKSPDKNLSINIDVVIITSPTCESIKSYMYRLSKIGYKNNHILLYNIYCKSTQEEKLLDNKELATNHVIVNNCEKTVISDENSDFVIVD